MVGGQAIAWLHNSKIMTETPPFLFAVTCIAEELAGGGKIFPIRLRHLNSGWRERNFQLAGNGEIFAK
ncbi:MAG TPA: hypothetical protein IGS40_01805 [Trichormus sp. M33_DOE_039]|nr:hypothetical protein [Trichormus sp. M33_DOE_039]